MAKNKRRFPWSKGRHRDAARPPAKDEPATRAGLLTQINHIFLPPKLPKAPDTSPAVERALIKTTQTALAQFRDYFDANQTPELDRCVCMLGCMIDARDEHGVIDKNVLGGQLASLEDQDCIALRIEGQNAGLVVTRSGEDVRFESLELLAPSDTVITCTGRLQRCFPDRAIAVAQSRIEDATFRDPFLDVLCRLDRHGASATMEVVQDPRLITEMTMGVLRGIGSVVDVPHICKHSREESLRDRSSSGSQPWRRSSLWLLIRVALQLMLDRAEIDREISGQHKPKSLYKAFMIFLMSSILERAALARVSHDMLFVMKAKISRRILKLGPADDEAWLCFARGVLKRVDTVLTRKWESIQSPERHAMELSALSTLDFDQDTILSLESLRPHLAWISGRQELEDQKDDKIQGIPFQRLGGDEIPSGDFRRNKEIALLELAEFEHWVGSHIEQYNPPDTTPVRTSRKNRGKGKDMADAADGRGAAPWTSGCGEFRTEFEHDNIGDLDNNNAEGDDRWSVFVDNNSARKFWAEIETPNAFPQAGQPPARLCQRCESLPVSDHDLELFLQPAALATSSVQCELCSLLYTALSPAGAVHPARPIRLRREGSNLLTDGYDRPVLRLCTSPQWTGDDIIQVAPSALLEKSSDAFFALLAKWLRDCDDEHEDWGCHGSKSQPPLPTRVIDVGVGNERKANSDVRLVRSRKRSRGRYVALSHCWGKLTQENEPNCTFKSNLEDRYRGISFADLGKTFQDAVTVTRRLGVRYLWIDSLCIVQDDTEDWRREARRMQDVFHQAYCTIAATAAEDAQAGFLGPRPTSRSVAVQTSHGAPVYFCESVDDFRGDVERACLNQRGWVLQERALSRRTIHFGVNQTYWECGRGIFCETLARLTNQKARFLGDPQFPSLMGRESYYTRHHAFQSTFQMYSRLALTFPTDRPVAVAGVESRLAATLQSSVAFGIFGAHFYLHRSLLWRRSDEDTLLKPINVTIPSWSWMAYGGAIEYLDIAPGKVDWNTEIVLNTCSQLSAPVVDFAVGEMLRDVHRLVFDCRRTAHVRDLKCVVVGRQLLSSRSGEDEETRAYYILVVSPVYKEGSCVGYERLGIASVRKAHIAMDDGYVRVSLL